MEPSLVDNERDLVGQGAARNYTKVVVPQQALMQPLPSTSRDAKLFFLEHNHEIVKLTINSPTNWNEAKKAITTKLELENTSCKFKYQEGNKLVTIADEADWKEFFAASEDKSTIFVITDPSKPQKLSSSESKLILNPKNIKIDDGPPIGSGAFGVVYFGKHLATPVAIKAFQVYNEITKKNMQQELELLSVLPIHPNIVSFLGFCEIDKLGPCIVMERMGGSLLSALQDKLAPLNFFQKMECCKQIALGLEHLHAHNFIHRDLAARNCLVIMSTDVSAIRVKVTDFGLSKQTKQNTLTTLGSRAVYWTAIEGLEHDKFSRASDIWSFGVLMWEMFSDGEEPYRGITNMIKFLKIDNQRLEKPADCNPQIYELMKSCWELEPKKRPTISILLDKLVNFSVSNDKSVPTANEFFDKDFSDGEDLRMSTKFKESLVHFEIAAKKNFPGAYVALWWLFTVGGLLGPGNFWLEQAKKESDWIKNWALTGTSVGMFWAGTLHFGLGEHEQATYWLQKAAEQGHANAQSDLGYCFHLGTGFVKDLKKAVFWYQKSANQGFGVGQYNVGYCFWNGFGVAQDWEQAVYWFQKAAVQGVAGAQFYLGSCYRDGTGVARDMKQAAHWYKKSAEQGNSNAQNNLAYCYRDGLGVAQDWKQSAYYFQQSAEQGVVDSQYNLGVYYQNGTGLVRDLKTAVYWYQKAADQGDSSAQYNLGYCYQNGAGIPQDLKQGVYWYQKAADQGLVNAQFNLACCYQHGTGVTQNLKQAVYWYQKAADQGDTGALQHLKLIDKNK